MNKECKCTMREKLLGDGCSICNPQYIIGILQDELEELRPLEEWLEENSIDCLNRYYDSLKDK